MKKVVGLTGGIACGKSTVAKMFGALGVALVDADQLARDVVEPGSDGLRAIVEQFGKDYLFPDGSLNRKKLGARVFEDPEALRHLNAITHPRIAAAGMSRIAELQSTDVPYIMYEAALLVENNIHTSFASLVVVATTKETQMKRLMERDASDRDSALARIESQLPIADKIAVADYVVFNDEGLDETRSQVMHVHASLVEGEESK